MAERDENVKRIAGVNVTDAANQLIPRQIGMENTTNKIVKKSPAGVVTTHTPDGGDLEMDSVTITSALVGNAVFDGNGRLYTDNSAKKTEEIEVSDPITESVSEEAFNQADINIENAAILKALATSDWTLEVKTVDFTAEHRVIYSIDTTSGPLTVTIPDAINEVLFETWFLKSSDLTTPDVTVVTTGGQLIGGKTSQVIYGGNESFSPKSVGTEYQIFQDARNKLQDTLSRSTSIFSGFDVTISGTDTVDISAGIAGIVDPTSSDKSITSRFAGVTGLVITGLATRGYTFLVFNPSTGLIEQSLEVTSQENQITKPQVGIVLHVFGQSAIEAAKTWWTVGQNPSTRLSVLLDIFGVIKNGVTMHPVVGTNTVSVTSGEFLASGLNGDENLKAPDLRPIYPLSQSNAYTYADRDATIGTAPSPTVDYSLWDNNGVLTATASQKYYNYRMFIPVAGVADNANNQLLPTIWQYAQNEYGSLAEAKSALATGDDGFTIMPKLPDVSALCTVVTVRGGATNLDAAVFRQTDRFGGVASASGGAAVSNLTHHTEDFHKSGAVSGSVVIPHNEGSSVLTGHFLNETGTVSITNVECSLGTSSSNATSQIDVKIRSYPKSSTSEYQYGDAGSTLLDTITLFSAGAQTSAFYRSDAAISTATLIDPSTIIFVEVDTGAYTCNDATVAIHYDVLGA